MNPRSRAVAQVLLLVGVMALLFVLFPVVYRFAAGAAWSVVRLWWLVLLLALGGWLIWGLGRRPKE